MNFTSKLTLGDVCNTCNNQSSDYYVDMSDFILSEETEQQILGNRRPINIKWEDVTLLDLFNVPFWSDEEIINFIKERLWIDIKTKEWISRVNELFKKACNFYQDRYLRTLPRTIKDKKLNTTKSIIDFLRETKTSKRRWILNCAIAKISYSIADILTSEKVRRADILDRRFMEKINVPFQITASYEDENWNTYENGCVTINWRQIDFKIISRQKWIDSITWKEIRDPKYYAVDQFQDLVWVAIYVENEQDAAALMQYIDQMIYKWEWKITNKKWIWVDSITWNNSLNQTFVRKLEVAIENAKEEEEKKDWKWSSENYKDVKITWDIPLAVEWGNTDYKLPIWTEVQFIIWWHDNEKWLSFHPVYDYIKRFKEMTRLGIPIREIDIVKFVNDFFYNLEDNLKKKNKKLNEFLWELIEELIEKWFLHRWDASNIPLWLYKYFLSKLVKVSMWDWNTSFYCDPRALKLRDIWMHRNDLNKIKEKQPNNKESEEEMQLDL